MSLVWYDPDPPPVAGVPIKIKKQPRVREATVGEDGTYRLCGLPEKYEGKLQAQRKDGGTTAEVNVDAGRRHARAAQHERRAARRRRGARAIRRRVRRRASRRGPRACSGAC